ncbi:glycoside hydrolase family 44 protein [Dyadobacter endophyticus]|uniref:glycoside hydrolase family 44 protein n=1 Tax=Dyadobacter TaxID=120831 RepID=UPI003CF56F97
MIKPVLHQVKMCLVSAFLCSISIKGFAQNVTISVNATQDKRLISPNIYGKNDFLDHSVQFYKDAGLRFARMNGGNNASAYNWRAKLAVHPDWYNNVYPADWDGLAQKINTTFPDMQGMFAFQLLGRVASSGSNNFNDWAFNQSQYWSGVGQNLAGGGQVNTSGGSQALVDGNIDLFSKPWPADSSVAILDHWFGTGGLGLNKTQFRYWSMDNEVDIWNGTHDWAMPTLISASAFMDRYIELAKKAKAIDPNVKICGPVTTSEWQWYRWSNESIWIDGRYYPWMEYFIKRLGDEYKATGVKLVDVLDIHNYPWYNGDDAAALQGHRIYYDQTYDYPGSNGIRTMNGGWDTSITKQYIFKRIDDWLTEHFGPNHGITPGVSEWGTMSGSNPSLESVIYASHLGTFANHGVEVFAPWNWSVGMWETLHLFSRNAKKYSVASTSSLDNTVSAYSSVTENADSLTVMLVNRDMNAPRTVTVNLSNFTIANGNYKTLQLASLPATETFVSHTQNALQEGTAAVNSNSLTITVPALSTTAILLANQTTLPVTLINFSGKASSEGNVLLWSTAEEVNNQGFEIERSLNGVRFEKIGFVPGKISASARVDYQFVDKQPLANGYYRLKQLDIDQSYTFSKSINVKNESGIKGEVYPNPVSGVLHFDVPAAKRRLIVRNMAGVVVDDKVDFSASSYETAHLPKGLYLISLGSYTFKVVIE